MNYVKRDDGVAKSLALESPNAPPRKPPKWTISYRAVAPLTMACDALIIYLTGFLSSSAYHIVRLGRSVEPLRYAGFAVVVAALFILVGQTTDRYDPAELLDFKSQIRRITFDWLGVFIFLTAIAFTIKVGEDFSRGAVLSFVVSGVAALIIERIMWRIVLANGLAIRKFSSRKVALIADQGSAIDSGILEALTRHGMQPTYQFLLPANQNGTAEWEKVIAQAISALRGSDIEEIVVSVNLDHWSNLDRLFFRLRMLPLPVNLVPVGPVAELLRLPSHTIGETITIELQRGPRTFIDRAIKRTADILFASIALILLSPVLLIATVAIKLGSRGPIIFRQRRCGFNGRQFNILKFRTMSVQEDGDTIIPAEPKDLRVTRVGTWLRRTSIDELPQLLNVLRGEMSVVGPRPHAVAHDTQFDNLVGNYAYRQHVKPGITGWAQVHGCRGSMKNVPDIEQRVKLDLWYINNWSLAVDFKILLMTAIEIIRGQNAY